MTSCCQLGTFGNLTCRDGISGVSAMVAVLWPLMYCDMARSSHEMVMR